MKKSSTRPTRASTATTANGAICSTQGKDRVKKGDSIDWREVEIEYTHHGPLVAHKGGKAYSMAIPYANEVGLTDQIHEMMTARNLDEMKRALGHLQLMSQNIMVGTVQGDIYYVRNGRVPIRAKEVEPNKPIPGNTSATEWQGIHPLNELVQIANPPGGYMHNCNVTPFGMMKDSPLVPEKYISYIYNASRTGPRHQRAEMMTDLLDAAKKVTLDEAIDIAFSAQVYHAELWQARLKAAWAKASGQHSASSALSDGANGRAALTADAIEVYDLIQKWNRKSDAESEGALAFYAFKKGLSPEVGRQVEVPADITDDQLIGAVGKASEWLKSNFGPESSLWKYFIGESSDRPFRLAEVAAAGLTRSIASARDQLAQPERNGGAGGRPTQIVVMTNPPKSYAIIRQPKRS
jgi:acyl-homoserine lactone acylase PvdQ